MQFVHSLRERMQRNPEGGFTLIEIMVSIAIIAGILVASGVVISGFLRSEANLEMRDRGTQIGRDFLEQYKALGYEDLVVYNDIPKEQRTEDDEIPATYNGEKVITASDNTGGVPFERDAVQDARLIRGNTEYHVWSYVTETTAWDSSTAPAQTGTTTINGKSVTRPLAKRITVKVTWEDFDSVKSITNSYIRAATIAECIPPRTEAGGNAGSDLYSSSALVRACEGATGGS